MGFRLVHEFAADGLDVAVTCRVLKVSRSGYYQWRGRALAGRDWADAYLANTIHDIHTGSRRCYGAPRVHDELRLGRGIRVASSVDNTMIESFWSTMQRELLNRQSNSPTER